MLQKLDGEDLSNEQMDLWLQHTKTCLALSSVDHKNKFLAKDLDIKQPADTNIIKQKSFHSTKKKCLQKKTVYSKAASKEDLNKLDEFINSELVTSNTAENDQMVPFELLKFIKLCDYFQAHLYFISYKYVYDQVI